MINVKMIKQTCEKVTKQTQKLGVFYGVNAMYQKKFMKPSKKDPKKCVLTSKGKLELKRKAKEFPRLYGGL